MSKIEQKRHLPTYLPQATSEGLFDYTKGKIGITKKSLIVG